MEAETVRVLPHRGDLVTSETKHGFVCANAGVDLSNATRGFAALLPEDSDRSARRIRDGLRARASVDAADLVLGKATGLPVAVIRGVDPSWLRRGEVHAEIVRDPAEDLFR